MFDKLDKLIKHYFSFIKHYVKWVNITLFRGPPDQINACSQANITRLTIILKDQNMAWWNRRNADFIKKFYLSSTFF